MRGRIIFIQTKLKLSIRIQENEGCYPSESKLDTLCYHMRDLDISCKTWNILSRTWNTNNSG